MAVSEDDLTFCRRRVLENDPWFKLSDVFLPAATKHQVLALHALIASIEDALLLSDEALSLAQLGWWQSELSEEQARQSGHPVVRLLRNSGTLQLLSQDLIAALLHQALERLQVDSISSEEELKSICDRVGKAQLTALSAVGPEVSKPVRRDMVCAGTGLSMLLFSALRGNATPLWFLPLTLQARHGCDARAVALGSNQGRAILRSLEGLSRQWFEEQLAHMGRSDSGLSKTQPSSRHIVAWVLTGRLKTARTLRVMRRSQSGAVAAWRPSDFVKIWAACRRITRSMGGKQ